MGRIMRMPASDNTFAHKAAPPSVAEPIETMEVPRFEIPQVILDAAAAKREFYYLLSTGEVVEGPQGSWRDRIGPYPTRDAAAHALQLAKHRDAAWEEQTKAYRE